jgi:hypothetical protein
MKTIQIKDKEYVPVVERVKEFHIQHKLGVISTEIVSNNEQRVVVKATVTFPTYASSEIRTFTGHSQAEWGKGMMGGVALEVAETSAVGRALGFANIGLLDGIASADEIRKVSKKVNTDKPPFGEGSVEEENEDFNI